jgi:hypothetical protein
VYDQILDLRIATPQIVLNYALFLEVRKAADFLEMHGQRACWLQGRALTACLEATTVPATAHQAEPSSKGACRQGCFVTGVTNTSVVQPYQPCPSVTSTMHTLHRTISTPY